MTAHLNIETGSKDADQTDEMLKQHERVMNAYINGLGMAFEMTQEMLKLIMLAVSNKCTAQEFADVLKAICTDMPVIVGEVEKLRKAADDSQDNMLKVISERNETHVERMLDGNDLSDAQAALASITKPT